MSPSIATKRLEHEGNAPPRVASSTGEQERSKGKGKGAAKPAVSQIPAFDRQALQRWILSVGCVTFDLDLGPDLEFLYPPLGISKEEKDNIAFSSFPDTSIFDDGYTTFSWRVREVPLHSSYSEAPVIGRLNKPPPPGPSPAASSFSSSPDRNSASRSAPPPPSTASALGPNGGGSALNGKLLSQHPSMASIAAETSHSRNNSATSTGTTEPSAAALSNLPGGSTSSSYIYGVCFFRQKRDPSIRRGYFQKSVVILSHLPYVSLLTELVSKLGPLYFEHGQPMLEAFIQDVVRWPAPESGVTLTLPALGSVLKVSLPIGSQFQTDAATNAYIPSLTNPNMATSLLTKKKITQPGRQPEPEPLLASIPTTPLIDTFRDALADLWLLWECMLLADPILVIGPDPKACSDAVWHLLDLIRPIPYAGDFRPYFHIHDYDCGALVTKNKPQAGTLLGVTNPFFVAACGHWPNLLRVGRPAPKVTHHFGIGRSGSASKKPTAPGRKRRASKDRPLLKAMVDAVEKQEGVEAANGMLRRYFSDLTERFLQPLNRYIASLVPSSGAIPTLPGEPLRIKPFNTNDFLGSLKAHGTPLLLKNRNLPTGAAIRQSLYLDFLKCPNFSLWLHAKLAAADDDNWRRRIKVLEMGDVQRFAQRNGEIETIDLLSRLREEIVSIAFSN
ncbi:DUF1630-domain-containing protein [Tilletiaria anomala UBC 951]|uniref:DUF1630-domain-containing protein n=1 Tax=Tilletiaria anomala (strain ATCC 24038 / CBS 436.72 / UBC 951) TaxID=1037660 RepID=A0A066WDY1_TILAU|nr:DUF1630-domain-containing protein [Tilletiaria anomala UBC 951]KDN52162.1 DUF1630-domain-containing protein [Tilletiaria anomala UBC 951]